MAEISGTIAPCPHGCGGHFDTWRDKRCPSCRRLVSAVTVAETGELAAMEFQWPGACFDWFGPADHRMRCRMPEGHAGEHSSHNDLNGCGAVEQTTDDWPTHCEMPRDHLGPHDWELRSSRPDAARTPNGEPT